MDVEIANTAVSYAMVNIGAAVALVVGSWLLSVLTFRFLAYVDRLLSPRESRPGKSSLPSS